MFSITMVTDHVIHLMTFTVMISKIIIRWVISIHSTKATFEVLAIIILSYIKFCGFIWLLDNYIHLFLKGLLYIKVEMKLLLIQTPIPM